MDHEVYIEYMQNGEETKPEPSEAEAMEELARRSSTMPPIGIDLCGFATTDLANSVGAEVQGCLYQFGKLPNFKRLMRVIVACNYEETLGFDSEFARSCVRLRPEWTNHLWERQDTRTILSTYWIVVVM
jgi:hypothetical protein